MAFAIRSRALNFWPRRLHLRLGLSLSAVLLLLVVLHAGVMACWSGPWCTPVQWTVNQYGYLFDMSREMNIPSWYSVVLLFLVALGAAAIARTLLVGRRPWYALAGLFVYLSMDELAELHGLWPIILQLEATEKEHLNLFLWIIPGAFLVVIIGAAFLHWLLRLPGQTRNYFLLAGLVYVTGGLGFEVLGSFVADPTFFNPAYIVVSTLEEALEMAGIIIMLMGLVVHAQIIGLRVVTDQTPLV